MQGRTVGRWCVLVLACMALVVTLNAQTTNLPISDFLAAQGQTSIYVPPVPDFLGWVQALCISGGLNCLTPPYEGLCGGTAAAVDYAGLADKFITQNGGESSGTEINGSVLVRPLGNGRVEVKVSLHTKNALTFVIAPSSLIPGTSCSAFDYSFAAGPLLLGARATSLPPLSQRALGQSFVHIIFENPMGAPLPDLIDLFNNRFSDIKEYSFHAVAEGLMQGGTHGTVTVQQAGKGSRSNLQPAIVNLRQTGN